MLEQLLDHLKNWFVVPDGVHPGEYSIENGGIALPFLAGGQYYRICGSVFNDGVYQYPATDLTDEMFTGAIWALAVPPAVIAIAAEIEAWQTDNPESTYISESFGGYSYTKAATSGGAPATWQDVFRGRLNPWRKI